MFCVCRKIQIFSKHIGNDFLFIIFCTFRYEDYVDDDDDDPSRLSIGKIWVGILEYYENIKIDNNFPGALENTLFR